MNTKTIDGYKLKVILESAAFKLEANKDEVNSLNVFPVPDGDTGTNMLLTMKSALKQGLDVQENDAHKVAQAASQGSLMGARGNSGVILSQLFRGFASGLEGKKEIDIATFALGLKKAADTAYKAVMKPTEGTILTVARECGEKAMSICNQNEDMVQFLEEVLLHGNDILSKTPDMLPVLKQAGVVDAGGKGLLYLIEGALEAISDEKRSLVVPSQIQVEPIIEKPKKRDHIDTDDIEFGYCTEFMINTNYGDVEEFREQISANADSLLVVGGEGIIKVHIHTNNPGDVLEKALKLGELSDIKIDNMRYQHEEVLLKDELSRLNNNNYVNETINDEQKRYSIIAISLGEGIDELFKDMNVDVIVSGGQTMNPSTEDILSAIDKTKGEHVIILPNNSNIILAAEQTKHLSERSISVIPTKSIPQGISALLVLDEDVELEINLESMINAIDEVKTGQVTFAVRDTEFNGTDIRKNDIIGLSDKDILAAGNDVNTVSQQLIEKLVDQESSIITIIYGSDVTEEQASKLAELLEAKYSNLDIEVVFGGQPLYYYLFAIE
ncbi:DAK2 domain-containing protein [Gudongella sp. DL1XJH-153]|uniref:DAK2 domain-containing protein n=1 Tax=Gudongella sp. DL1XJH-153 TaxID=3409804 RepID=UPI003BB6658F